MTRTTFGWIRERRWWWSLGGSFVRDPHGVGDELFARLAVILRVEQIVALTAFGGLMVATNLFNNALQVDLDEYLAAFREGVGGRRPADEWGPGAIM